MGKICGIKAYVYLQLLRKYTQQTGKQLNKRAERYICPMNFGQNYIAPPIYREQIRTLLLCQVMFVRGTVLRNLRPFT